MRLSAPSSQGILYKEYSDNKREWEREREQLRQRVREMEALTEAQEIRHQELKARTLYIHTVHNFIVTTKNTLGLVLFCLSSFLLLKVIICMYIHMYMYIHVFLSISAGYIHVHLFVFFISTWVYMYFLYCSYYVVCYTHNHVQTCTFVIWLHTVYILTMYSMQRYTSFISIVSARHAIQ